MQNVEKGRWGGHTSIYVIALNLLAFHYTEPSWMIELAAREAKVGNLFTQIKLPFFIGEHQSWRGSQQSLPHALQGTVVCVLLVNYIYELYDLVSTMLMLGE